MTFFTDFEHGYGRSSGGDIFYRRGGEGPPILLLHGHPRTHATWEHVAPLLARSFTVICPDVPGFGQSYIPVDAPRSLGSSKRAKAAALLELMKQLGFDRFALVGHDRGAYTAFRLAMDHPSAVERLVILDAVPIAEALERCDAKFAKNWWHWFFFAQPEKPERAILADPDAWYNPPQKHLVSADAMALFRRSIHDERVVHGMIEDYRAGLGIDRQHDEEDRTALRKIRCPTMVIWSDQDDMGELYGDPRSVWAPWVDSTFVTASIHSGHHVAEEAPQDLANALTTFFKY